jgi:transcriptional regulator with XRE-family HTH domain
MAKNFNELIEKMAPEHQAWIEERVQVELAEMALKELRQALQLTQQQLASQLELNQAAVSKMERQSDMYISTLRRFLSAMGAELRIIAHFPERDILINQFHDLFGDDEVAVLREQSPEYQERE